MPTLGGLEIAFDADAVLRGQGADPAVLRQRSPDLVQLAEQALQEGLPLLEPQVAYRRCAVEQMRHERLLLEGGGFLSGSLIAQHLGGAREVIVLVCTVGAALEEYASEVMRDDILRGLALDGVGSAATEALANAACLHFEREAQAAGLQTSIPLSPGMLGWTVDEGQPQIFSLIDGGEIGVTLTESAVMIPRKSLSMVLGIGPQMVAGRTCDFCTLRETCRYQEHYTPAAG